MGFKDKAINAQALKLAQGRLDGAVELLLANAVVLPVEKEQEKFEALGTPPTTGKTRKTNAVSSDQGNWFSKAHFERC